MTNFGITPYFSLFTPNAGKYGPEKNSVFGHFSRMQCFLMSFFRNWTYSL